MESTTIATVVVTCVATTCAVVAAGYGVHRAVETMRDLKSRIEKLEDAQEKRTVRLPYKLANGLEDVISVFLDVTRHIDEIKAEASAMEQRQDKALQIMQTLRGNYHDYDDEAPAGPKPRRTK